MNRKVAELFENNPERKRVVHLTPNGPILTQGDASSPYAIETHEIDEATWNEMMALLQTGELDHAKVKSIIKAQQ